MQNELVNNIASEQEKKDILEQNYPSVQIANRFVSDCEMIANGGFSPLTGFMDEKNAQCVIDTMTLCDGSIWSIPVLLPTSEDVSGKIILTDETNRPIALMDVTSTFTLDMDDYCEKVYKTASEEHPGVAFVKKYGNRFISGDILLLNRPVRENIDDSYFMDPVDTRAEFKKRGWNTVVAFQTRNPIHRAHEYITKCALETVDGLLIHPIVGETKADDIPADVRMKCYDLLIQNYYNPKHTMVSVLPAAMRYAGPREAVHHILIRKNYGCTHMIVGRDHAGVGDYYGTYEAQELLDTLTGLGISPMKFEHSFYCHKCDEIVTEKTCPHDSEFYMRLSGTKVRELLKEGVKPPKEFTRDEIAELLIDWATNK